MNVSSGVDALIALLRREIDALRAQNAALRADNAEHLAAAEGDRHAVDGAQTAELPDEAAPLEREWAGGGRGRRHEAATKDSNC